jgi:tRNA 2-thiouridine synthesizing protein C
MMDNLLILARATPYGSQQASAALDITLTAAAFELDVSVVFLDDGVLQLLTGQDTEDSGQKNVGKMIPALALYDVGKVYIHSPSAEHYGIHDSHRLGDIALIDDNSLQDMTAAADQVLVFC